MSYPFVFHRSLMMRPLVTGIQPARTVSAEREPATAGTVSKTGRRRLCAQEPVDHFWEGRWHLFCSVRSRYRKQPHSHADIITALKDCSAVLCYGMGWRAAEDLERNGIRPLVIGGEATPREAVQQFITGNLNPASGFCRCHG